MSQSIIIYVSVSPTGTVSARSRGPWFLYFVSWDLAQIPAYDRHAVIVHQIEFVRFFKHPVSLLVTQFRGGCA